MSVDRREGAPRDGGCDRTPVGREGAPAEGATQTFGPHAQIRSGPVLLHARWERGAATFHGFLQLRKAFSDRGLQVMIFFES